MIEGLTQPRTTAPNAFEITLHSERELAAFEVHQALGICKAERHRVQEWHDQMLPSPLRPEGWEPGDWLGST